MNRGLYRGKRIDTDDWIYGFYAKSGDKAYIIKDNDIAIGYLTMKEVAPETVCEFTGLYTAEGAEIYENDICRFDDRNFIVKRECDIPGGNWMETGFALKEIGYADYVHFTDTFEDSFGELQVAIVGNAFDNKDIMKGWSI